jgi:hypothetical protein
MSVLADDRNVPFLALPGLGNQAVQMQHSVLKQSRSGMLHDLEREGSVASLDHWRAGLSRASSFAPYATAGGVPLSMEKSFLLERHVRIRVRNNFLPAGFFFFSCLSRVFPVASVMPACTKVSLDFLKTTRALA